MLHLYLHPHRHSLCNHLVLFVGICHEKHPHNSSPGHSEINNSGFIERPTVGHERYIFPELHSSGFSNKNFLKFNVLVVGSNSL